MPNRTNDEDFLRLVVDLLERALARLRTKRARQDVLTLIRQALILLQESQRGEHLEDSAREALKLPLGRLVAREQVWMRNPRASQDMHLYESAARQLALSVIEVLTEQPPTAERYFGSPEPSVGDGDTGAAEAGDDEPF